MALGSVLGVAMVLISLLDGWLYFTIWYVMCGLGCTGNWRRRSDLISSVPITINDFTKVIVGPSYCYESCRIASLRSTAYTKPLELRRL